MAAPRSEIPAWVGGYIGLPFEEFGRTRAGIDCWGLVRLVLAEQFRIDVPSYVGRYESTADAEELGRLIRGEMAPWRPVEHGAEQPGDVVLLRVKGQPMHVGIVVAPGWMLHIEQETDATTEAYDGLAWGRRVVGIYRYQPG